MLLWCCCGAVAVLLQCCCSAVAVLLQCCCSAVAVPRQFQSYGAIEVLLRFCCSVVAVPLQCSFSFNLAVQLWITFSELLSALMVTMSDQALHYDNISIF